MKMKRKWTTSTRFMLIILYFDLIKETITVPCPASLHTANDVQRCPRNELEWNAHAARLNCSSINQTCVNPSIFEYHCVLNKEGNGLLENRNAQNSTPWGNLSRQVLSTAVTRWSHVQMRTGQQRCINTRRVMMWSINPQETKKHIARLDRPRANLILELLLDCMCFF
uniref:Uncharacterized protein LOC111103664 isoform X3 n=1 Tax=Crassostrea virginica TaxID=6565 RepID=A0A8B8AQ86_CRAVI|nr:uncharacterized protein LOC111103664 isoform X3 [Crassostrea virginica]